MAHSLATIYWKAMEFQQHLFCSGVHASSWSWCSSSKAQFTVLSLWRESILQDTARNKIVQLLAEYPPGLHGEKDIKTHCCLWCWHVVSLVFEGLRHGFRLRQGTSGGCRWMKIESGHGILVPEISSIEILRNTISRCCRGIPLNGNLVYEHKPWRIWSHYPGLELGTDQFGRSKSTAVRIYKAVDWIRRYNI